MPDQKTMWTRCLGGFSVMWVTKLLIPPVKKRIFCPKTTKFGPNLAFPFIACSFGALLVGWLVVVARAVSRKTPFYFIIITSLFNSSTSGWAGAAQARARHPFQESNIVLLFFFILTKNVFILISVKNYHVFVFQLAKEFYVFHFHLD